MGKGAGGAGREGGVEGIGSWRGGKGKRGDCLQPPGGIDAPGKMCCCLVNRQAPLLTEIADLHAQSTNSAMQLFTESFHH